MARLARRLDLSRLGDLSRERPSCQANCQPSCRWVPATALTCPQGELWRNSGRNKAPHYLRQTLLCTYLYIRGAAGPSAEKKGKKKERKKKIFELQTWARVHCYVTVPDL
jgi:hypothetical protein